MRRGFASIHSQSFFDLVLGGNSSHFVTSPPLTTVVKPLLLRTIRIGFLQGGRQPHLLFNSLRYSPAKEKTRVHGPVEMLTLLPFRSPWTSGGGPAYGRLTMVVEEMFGITPAKRNGGRSQAFSCVSIRKHNNNNYCNKELQM